jgi:starch synthase
MRVLFVSSEVAPFSKTGGLGDVTHALPLALAALGHEVRVVTPLYREVPREGLARRGGLTLEFPFGEVDVAAWHRAADEGVEQVFLEAPLCFDRERPYGYPDDARRFAAFSMGALALTQASGFEPDVVHANDWQTGLVMPALTLGFAHTPLGRARRVFTIHNLAYQGNFAKAEVQALGLPWSLFVPGGVEFYEHLSFMKAGLVYAQRVTTVSPTYAKEIQTKAGGMGMDGVVRAVAGKLSGILNGVDAREWNPATDVLLPARYSAQDLSGKARCREELLAAWRLQPPAEGMPVFGLIGRMVHQKGADLSQAALPRLLEQGARAVVLGTGDEALQQAWRALAARFPGRLGVHVGFEDAKAHLIEAGSDFFVMPSRFEPCGLNQLYSQLYGAVPVVHGVGGLKDTVVDLAEADATGVVFGRPTTEALFNALTRAVELYRDARRYAQVQRRGMTRDFSWAPSARAYVEVYQQAAPA